MEELNRPETAILPYPLQRALIRNITAPAEAAGQTGYTKFKGVQLVDRAGHWPQEEQPGIVSQQLIGFLKST